MNLVFLVILASIFVCQAEEIHQTRGTIKNAPESLNVAKNFRKALLDALEQLEKDEIQYNNNRNNSFDKDDLDASDYDEDDRTKFGHKIRDNISKQEAIVTSFTDGGKASVFVHSFSTNSENKFSKDKKNTEDSSTVKNRIKQAPDNVISASITSTISGRRNQLVSNSNNKEVSKVLPTPTAPVTEKTVLTSPSPTVSTPAEDEDETKAKVEDVQFIHAPLVAAFTVEQDDKGLPQKVIPIYGNKQGAHNQFTIQDSRQNIQSSLEEKQRLLEQQIRILQEQKRQQEFLIQQQLLQQHRLKIKNDINSFSHSLQKQNEVNNPLLQHNSIDNNQHGGHPHFSHQKNILNTNLNDVKILQNQNLSTQSQILSNLQNRFNIPIPAHNNPSSFSSRPTKDLSNTVVSFQPSISFQPNGFNSINPFINQNPQTQTHLELNPQQYNHQQRLPIKAAVNFQKAIDIPVHQPDNSLTQQQVPNQFRNHVFNSNNDNYLQDFFYRQRTLVPPPPRGNRVFRQETQVGNFGLNDFTQHNFQHHQRFNQPVNNNFNNDIQNSRYNSFNGIQNSFNSNNNRHISNQFFNNHNIHYNADNRLKNLLYNSGLGQGRSQEDLNIVSKVLALDHTGNYQNFLFGASNVSEKRIPFTNLHTALKT